MQFSLSIPGVTGIADDMNIYGRSDLEHDKHLLNFLEVCRKEYTHLESRQDAVQTSTSFHSLDTTGVPRGSVQIQRKLQQ